MSTTYLAVTVKDAFVASLQTSLSAAFKAVSEGWLNSAAVQRPPVLNVSVGALRKTGGPYDSPDWEMDMFLQIAGTLGTADFNEKILQLIAEVMDALITWEAKALPGSVAVWPVWDTWLGVEKGEATPLGAIGTMSLKFSGRLKTVS